MRVIAGSLGGRNFESPSGHKTHPMSEKIRGALFNALGDIEGLTILDAFAGTGAVSFEALSRGAARAVAVEKDKAAHKQITANAQSLGIASANIKIIRANVASWSDNNQTGIFDIVVCDPPYDDVKPAVIKKLANHCKPGGVIVFSLPPNVSIDMSSEFSLLSSKSYGDAALHFYRKR